MVWLAVILGVQCVVLGLIGWFLATRNASLVRKALADHSPASGKNVDRVQVCDLLATVGRSLSEHDQMLETFEQTLDSADDRAPILASLDNMRQANQQVEQSVEATITSLIATCGDLLSDEQASLEAYRDKTMAVDASLSNIKHDEILVHLVGTLLGMVQELRAENKVVQNDVVASKDKIIQLLSRANSAEKIARVDTLTQLPNRRAFDEAYAQCVEIQEQTGHVFSLVLLDIDHFKSVNDEYGHAAGDAVLSLFARILRENCKSHDHACRLGGEEFGILLPRCNEKLATSVAELHRQKISAAVLQYGGHKISVTVSCGVAEAIPGNSLANLMERADVALYEAKTRGRNQTFFAGCVADENRELVAAT